MTLINVVLIFLSTYGGKYMNDDKYEHLAEKLASELTENEPRYTPRDGWFTRYVTVPHIDVFIKELPNYYAEYDRKTGLKVRDGLPPLKKATIGSAGMDCYAALEESVCLKTLGSRALIPTGISMAIPRNYELQIRPRSGLADKYGLTVLNTPGTIDSDYRGELGVIVVNMSASKFWIERGMRLAQFIFNGPLPEVNFVLTDDLEETERGQGGFGHTGGMTK